MNAIDTNVLVYAVDQSDAKKARLAEELLEQLDLVPVPCVIPWQVAVEFVANLRRLERDGTIPVGSIETYLVEFVFRFTVVRPEISLLKSALRLSEVHSLSHWDSLLLAACQEAGVIRLYSEDLTNGATYGTVTVINPFV